MRNIPATSREAAGDTDSQNAQGAQHPTIRLTNVSKHFAGVKALTDVTVEFYPGEVHAILGENGAGKSTLMNIISGVLQPDHGEIEFEGQQVPHISPESASELGISISYQHPAVLNDLTVLENLLVALPRKLFEGRPKRDTANQILQTVGLHVPLNMRCEALTVAQKQLLEIAKALAVEPKLLILDEPTASLDQDSTDILFTRIREVVKAGTSVIYITHRLAELRQIAQRVTVLRDGVVRGGGMVSEVSDEHLLQLIVGRTLGSTFPPKAENIPQKADFEVRDLISNDFHDISFTVSRGEIVGIAGVAGNGQTSLARALAGLNTFQGNIALKGRSLNQRELLDEAAYMPADRHAEGLAGSLTIRENAAVASLERYASRGIIRRKHEFSEVGKTFSSLAVKAPGMEAAVSSLSGGNQQKIVLSRALLAQPGLIIADEPTQGVDVGARAEIYRILREISNDGTPVIVNSSDAAELEGLCDKVLVMSRGRIVETLVGEDVVEHKIVGAAVKAATADDARKGGQGLILSEPQTGWRHFVQLDNAPAVPLLVVTVLLALFGYSENPNFLSSFNVTNILLLATALGFVAMGQTFTLLLGAIDLSVGPLMGLLVVIGSFFVLDSESTWTVIAGFLLMGGVAILVGLVNGLLIRYANFTAIAATLAMFIGLQGVSFLLRDSPGGYITYDVIELITWQLGPIPVAFIVMVSLALAVEYGLRRTRPGWQLRALGSDEEAARRIGLHINRIFILGFIACSIFAALAAVMLMAQIGVGDPREGVNYTLASITAVVLGGTSLTGARGTLLGTVLGALLLTEVLSTVTFLGLSTMYQYYFQGALILCAALIYSAARRQAGA